jgi:plasmid maintenance system killer protein
MIRRRLDEFRAAETLAVIAKLPSARCHEYSGEKVGMLAVDLDHPYRLIFQPADDPIPLKEDGGLDWSKVKTIMILEVKDPHR